MANPTAGRDDKQSFGQAITVPMAASTTIYSGSLVSVNSAGYAVVAGDTASTVFMGVAADTVANTGSAGDKKIMVYVRGTFEMAFAGTATQATVGQAATISDGQTLAVAATTTNDIAAGKVVEYIDASTVRVLL
jgi:hypothetical protein